jgi:Penicillin tolerance protein
VTQLALERNKRTYQVTASDELDESWFDNCETVGISAGASTPDETIKEVVSRIKEIGHVVKKEIVYE